MRKEQEKILEKAKKHNMSQEQIAMLSREDITISILNIIYWYFRSKEDISASLLVSEADRCLSMVSEIPRNVSATDKKKLTEMILPPYRESDELFGSPKKARIIKMYRHYVQSGEKAIGFLYDYRSMLYNGFPAWHIGIVLRNSDDTLDGYWNTLGRLNRNGFLLDDFINNGKDSLYYYITERTDIAVKCKETEFPQIKKFYDMDTHRYSVPTSDFPEMFTYAADREEYVVNNDYFTRLMLSSSPVLNIVHEFCTSGKMKSDAVYSSISGNWSLKALTDPGHEEDLKKCIELLDKGFTVDFPSYYMRISISDTGFVNVIYKEYNSINVSPSFQMLWYQNKETFVREFMITPDGKLFRKPSGKNRYYPMSVKDFVRLYMKQNVCGELMAEILDYYRSQNIFYNDVINDMLATGCIMSLSFNEVMEYHNRAELITSKYKTANGLRIKWNKQNLNLSYMIMKSLTYVCPGKSREILLQQKGVSLLDKIPAYGKVSQKCMIFIDNILYKNITEEEKRKLTPVKRAKIEEKYINEIKEEINTDVLPDEYQTWINERVEKELSLDGIDNTIWDYVNMCHTTKNKVRLDVYSAVQLYNLHDRIANNPDDYRKKTGEVNVPKDSVFNELREILPPEFEWIKTRKRLILETELQHHCVWSYANKISVDKCAIYSYTDTNAEHCPDGVAKRYTIEFRRHKGKYYVKQVQGKYDRVNAGNMREYIEEILRKCEKKKMGK